MTPDAGASLPDGYHLPDSDEELLTECDVTTFMASGPGGQHRNRTESAVRLRHRPSGIVVIGRRERSQHRNRAEALARLRERVAALLVRPTPRRPTRASAASRRKRLEDKRRRGALKRERARRDDD